VAGQPGPDDRALVSGEIVADHVHLQPGGHGLVDPGQEIPELRGPVAAPTPAPRSRDFRILTHNQSWRRNGPQALASLRNLATGLFRIKNVKSIKEPTEMVHMDRMLAF